MTPTSCHLDKDIDKTTLPYYLNYKKTKHPETYFQECENQLILYGRSKHMLQQAEIDLKTLNIEKLKTKYEALTKLSKKRSS